MNAKYCGHAGGNASSHIAGNVSHMDVQDDENLKWIFCIFIEATIR